MSDPYIDQYETQSYGVFSVAQIRAHVRGMDPRFDGALDIVAGLVETATQAMGTALKKAGGVEGVTYSAPPGGVDPVAAGRDVLERLAAYARSREPRGAELEDRVLGGEVLSTVKRRRPVKLVGALTRAIEVVTAERAALPEADAWLARLGAARDAVDGLNTKVRGARKQRQEMTPEIAAARAAWLLAYGVAKLQVEAVLKLHDRIDLLSQVFDDLAEIHRAVGVSDGTTPAAPSGAATPA